MCEYPIVSIEDPFDQDDWEHYTKLTAEIGEQVQIVGDDLLVTNPKVCTHDYLWYLLFEDRFWVVFILEESALSSKALLTD